MFKKLHIKVCEIQENLVAFQITEQSHRGTRFATGRKFIPSFNKHMCMASCDCPEWDDDPNNTTLYVAGKDRTQDDAHIIVNDQIFKLILLMILEYNQKYNKNKLGLSDVVEDIEIWVRHIC